MYNEEEKMSSAMLVLDEKLGTIRAGRANPNILNGIMVPCYGVPTPIQSLANITVPEAKKLFVKPYDRTIIKDIERAINEKNIGLTPSNNGETIILVIPDLTEETRRDYVKQAKVICEEGKVSIRNIRQEVKDSILKDEYPKDEEKSLLEDLQELVNKYNKIVDGKYVEKERELMSV